MEDNRLKVLFQRYINGTCTRMEREELMKVIASSDDRRLDNIMEEAWRSLPAHRESLPMKKGQEILRSILDTKQQPIPLYPKPSFFTFTRVAAAFIILTLAGGTLYFLLIRGSINKEATAQKALTVDEHRYIKLPDGSTVILNAGSTLDFPSSFHGRPTRDVFLTGEGFFDIQHDPEKPFIVHTGKLRTTVLGTAFNIKAYDTEKSITVTVTRGKVKVGDDKETFGVITPDQEITFDKERKSSALKPVDSRQRIAWAEHDIFFDDISMGEAAAQLEKRFDRKITFRNERVKDCMFTATFVKGENLEQILQVICEFNAATYSEDENGTIRIDGEGCEIEDEN